MPPSVASLCHFHTNKTNGITLNEETEQSIPWKAYTHSLTLDTNKTSEVTLNWETEESRPCEFYTYALWNLEEQLRVV